ncbi:MAG: archease [Actinomycetota bacterium]|nr:archease [Actinomycetota bacterium]
MTRYEPLEHTADTGIVAYGRDLPELFENAAFGLFEMMFDLSGASSEEEREVSVQGAGREELLASWLEELLFVADSAGLALCSFSVEHLEDHRLEGRVGGLAFDQVELQGPPVKAITYHDLQVAETQDGWKASIIFDV